MGKVGEAICALTLAYVLSAGPACYLWNRGYLSTNFSSAAYRPLQPIEDVPVIGTAFRRYVDWWIPSNTVRAYTSPGREADKYP